MHEEVLVSIQGSAPRPGPPSVLHGMSTMERYSDILYSNVRAAHINCPDGNLWNFVSKDRDNKKGNFR